MLRYRYIPDRSKKTSPRSQEPSHPSTSLSPYPPHHVDDESPSTPRSSPIPPPSSSCVQTRPPPLQFSQSTPVISQTLTSQETPLTLQTVPLTTPPSYASQDSFLTPKSTYVTSQGTVSISQGPLVFTEATSSPPAPRRDLFQSVSPSPILEHPDDFLLISAPGVRTTPATSSPRHPRRATSLIGRTTATSSPRIPKRAATIVNDTDRLTSKDNDLQAPKKFDAFGEESRIRNHDDVHVIISKGTAATFASANDADKFGKDAEKFMPRDDVEVFGGGKEAGRRRCCEKQGDSMWDRAMDVQEFQYRFEGAYFTEQARTRLVGLKKLLGPKYHFEMACATDGENDAYCSKDGDIVVSVGTLAEGTSEI
ncbi:hypothetical protein ACOMHN_023014 [Nucella lapillus]